MSSNQGHDPTKAPEPNAHDRKDKKQKKKLPDATPEDLEVNGKGGYSSRIYPIIAPMKND